VSDFHLVLPAKEEEIAAEQVELDSEGGSNVLLYLSGVLLESQFLVLCRMFHQSHKQNVDLW
jgi:hypothetical protein